ncbi:hypothetical protein FGO68_gene2094 [Halteria grandinella]|uniref:Uncharacterized protein n=1 Tax=Halteria grandinella TaxID=5974 RepID=A0A8J8T2A9_HALGN|nr:hypothetical protein FGO68_gene2094 [Halteria grandinella]
MYSLTIAPLYSALMNIAIISFCSEKKENSFTANCSLSPSFSSDIQVVGSSLIPPACAACALLELDDERQEVVQGASGLEREPGKKEELLRQLFGGEVKDEGKGPD